MTKETPERFAKNVLWALAGNRAALDQLRDHMVANVAAVTGESQESIAERLMQEHKKLQRKLFDDLVRSSRLDDPSQDDPPTRKR